MSYRNDHDAALARAKVLETELAKVESERDRLRAEVIRMRGRSPSAGIPPRPTEERSAIRDAGAILASFFVPLLWVAVPLALVALALVADCAHHASR